VSAILGVGLAFMSSIFKSVSELTSKYSLNDDMNPYVAAFGIRGFAIPILSVLVWITGVPEIARSFWISLVISGLLNVLASILYMRALKMSDISIVSPIKAMAPMALLITSPIIINEYASPIGSVGVVFVTIGVYLLKVSKDQDNLLKPIIKLKNDRGARYAFYVMMIYSITSNVDKIGVESSSPIFWTFSIHVFVSFSIFLLMVYFTDNALNQLKQEWKKLIKRTALLWNIIGGTVLFGESDLKKRLPSGIVIVIGIIIISASL